MGFRLSQTRITEGLKVAGQQTKTFGERISKKGLTKVKVFDKII